MKIFQLITGLLFAALAVLVVLAVSKKPENWWLTADQQGERLLLENKFSQASEMFEDPMRQGVAFFRDGQFDKAAASFARVDSAESAFNRGDALVMLGNYEGAIASYDRALQFKPHWRQARENRMLAAARRDRLEVPDDDAGGTGGQLKPDEIVFDDRAKNSNETEEVEVGVGETMTDESLRELWLRRVQSSPADFLRVKFSYQLSTQDAAADEQEVNQ